MTSSVTLKVKGDIVNLSLTALNRWHHRIALFRQQVEMFKKNKIKNWSSLDKTDQRGVVLAVSGLAARVLGKVSKGQREIQTWDVQMCSNQVVRIHSLFFITCQRHSTEKLQNMKKFIIGKKKIKTNVRKVKLREKKKIKSLGQSHEKLLNCLFHSSVLFNRHIKLLVSVAFQWLTDEQRKTFRVWGFVSVMMWQTDGSAKRLFSLFTFQRQ